MISGSDDVINKNVDMENAPGNYHQKQEGCHDGHDVWVDFGHYTDGYGYADSDAESEYTPEEAVEVIRRAAVRCSTAGFHGRGSIGGRSLRGSLEKDSSACKGKVSLAEGEKKEAFSVDGDGGYESDCRDSAAGIDEEMSPLPMAGDNGASWGGKDGEFE